MSVEVRCRPIDSWQGAYTFPRRAATFDIRWDRALKELVRELDLLDARDVTIGINAYPHQIRVDGWPKANVTIPPPVSLTFGSKHGPLRYQCDRWTDWRDNLRAITLVLQRQRLVNDAGVGQDDQVYRGFGALPPGVDAIAMSQAMTLDQAIATLHHAAPGVEWDYDDLDGIRRAWRAATKDAHPDAGGDPARFRLITEARDFLLRRAA